MVVLRIKDLNLEEGREHLATDWEVSRTLDFSNIILRSREDRINLKSIVFNEVLDPNFRYYARAAVLLNTGYSAYGNIDVFIPDHINDLNTIQDLPSKVTNPILSSSSSRSKHDSTLFHIYVTGFSSVGNSTHESTSWYIEDIFGKAVWSKLNDKLNKTSVFVDEVILKDSYVYRVRAVFHSSSNDSSQVATMTISVGGGDEVNLFEFIDHPETEYPIPLTISNVPGLTKVTWEVVSMVLDVGQIIWQEETTGNTVIIPGNVLRSASSYILRIKTNITDSWKYIPFNTM